MAQPVYYLKVDTTAIKVLLARTAGPFGSPDVAGILGQAVRKWGLILQTRAVYNVTGHVVTWEGGAFVVRVRTGTLRSAIELQWPFESQFQARVFVNGTVINPGDPRAPGRFKATPVSDYAAAIEFGHDEIDLKQFMKGKTVPFFGAKAQKARGPYAATGLRPDSLRNAIEFGDATYTDYGSFWRSQELDRKLQAKGKGPMVFEKKGGNAAYTGAKRGASTYFISFRKVGNTGWVIPEARPRPFLRAALEGTKDQGRRVIANAAKEAFNPNRR